MATDEDHRSLVMWRAGMLVGMCIGVLLGVCTAVLIDLSVDQNSCANRAEAEVARVVIRIEAEAGGETENGKFNREAIAVAEAEAESEAEGDVTFGRFKREGIAEAEAEVEAEGEASFGRFKRAASHRAFEFSIDEDDNSRFSDNTEREEESEDSRSQLYFPFASTTSFWTSSRSTPKPRPPSQSAIRPNITFLTDACPPPYAAW